MSSAPSERLLDCLLHVDADMLQHAYDTDCAERLRAYIRERHAKRGNTPTVTRRVATAAACLLICLGCIFFPTGIEQPQPIIPPVITPALMPWEDMPTDVQINSIDMLNYYAAMHVLSEEAAREENALTARNVSAAASEKDEGIYYHELDPNTPFTVYRVIYFRIEVTEDASFLAERIGAGTVDVVITENSLEPMITFKHGDRYYTCCENSVFTDGKLYSTHKYIDGFYFVKNLAQENSSFRILYEPFDLEYRDAAARSVVCTSTIHGGGTVDAELSVIGKTYISEHSITLTVRELEDHMTRRPTR